MKNVKRPELSYCLLSIILLPFFSWILPLGTISGEEALDVSIKTGMRLHSPKDTVVLAVQCGIPRGYHLYGNPLGPGIGKPLRVRVRGASPVKWLGAKKTPARRFYPDVGQWVWTYDKKATFFLIGILKSNRNKRVSGTVILEGLLCADACVPFVETIPFVIMCGDKTEKYPFEHDSALRELYVKAEPVIFSKAHAKIRKNALITTPSMNKGAKRKSDRIDWDYEPVDWTPSRHSTKAFGQSNGLFAAIIFAFIAGIILNAMPCVLPVLGVKALSLARAAGGGQARALAHGTAFSLGMLTVFMVLATLAAFAGYSWGEHFRNPWVLAAIIALIFIFALGMFDVYTIPALSFAARAERKLSHSLAGEFARGAFTTVLATPCSGPFLGATLAWTLTQPPEIIYAVFISLGLGMASPYLILTSSRRFRKLIPPGGQWMEDLKRALGFLLIAFAVYLMSGLRKEMILAVCASCTAFSAGALIYRRYAKSKATAIARIAIAAFSLLIFIAGSLAAIIPMLNNDKQDLWQPFSAEKLQDAHMTGRHVLANFTASWCVNCQYNKMYVFSRKEIRELARRKEVMMLEVDMTEKNPAGESLLAHLGSKSIPFMALFAGDDPYRPMIFRDILNEKQLAEKLRELPDK